MTTIDATAVRIADAVRSSPEPSPHRVSPGSTAGPQGTGRTTESPTDVVPRAADRVVTAVANARRTGSRDAWLAVAAQCQELVNSATAVQDTAITEVARRESVWAEDGTLGEAVHAPGRVAVDAADLVAPAIGASHAQAQRRVQQAVRLAAGRVPVEVDDAERPEASGLGGLHAAMVAGRLDGYRAGVIADELEAAPPEVADAIVSALGAHLDADAAALRRRTRQLVARISPDLLRRRAKRARASTGLRRWVAEPGVDAWFGTFPSEDAATAWAAVDRLAHDLVADGTCSSVEQARGRALTDLVTGSATVDVQVVLTVPADTGGADHAAAEPGVDGTSAASAVRAASTPVPADQRSGPVPAEGVAVAGSPTGEHDDDLVEVQGARPSEPLLVRRGWLRDHLPKAASQPRRGTTRARPPFVPCDPLTGARLDSGDRLSTTAYRPGPELAAMVRARDGRCRFPGCGVAARFCDLDHVRPWPIGRTAARNLLTLCRRHHRIKQRPGWRVHLAPDGSATWTDPTGRVRTTAPLDALAALVLPADAADTTPEAPGPTPRDPTASVRRAPAPGWSALETHLGLGLEHHVPGTDSVEPHVPILLVPDQPVHRRCTSSAALRAAHRRRVRAPVHGQPPY